MKGYQSVVVKAFSQQKSNLSNVENKDNYCDPDKNEMTAMMAG